MALNPKTLTLISSLLLLSIFLISAATTSAAHDDPNPNPYLFGKERFRHLVRSKYGSVKALEKFHESSELLLGISNYRVEILNMAPHAFMMPKHSDANTVYYVANGEAVVNIWSEKDKGSVNLRKGDILRISAGAMVTLLNTHDNENLNVIMLLQPVSIPGNFEEFFPIGGQDPESYLRSFSDEILRAAYNNDDAEMVKGVFGKQSKGVIFMAPEEKVKAIRSHRGVSLLRAFNLLRKRPSQSNERGKLYDADANDYEELRDLDVEFTFTDINGGSMMAPFYNMWATKVSIILSGKGSAEMVCPHLATQQKGQGQRYQQVKSNLSPGTVLVTPPGHPIAIVASKGENLQILSFDIHANNNQRIFLSGTNNVFKGMDKEVKELAFDASESEVDVILDAQKSEVFVAGPEESQILASVLKFAGLK